MLNTLHIQDISDQGKSTTQLHLLTPNQGSARRSLVLYSVRLYIQLRRKYQLCRMYWWFSSGTPGTYSHGTSK